MASKEDSASTLEMVLCGVQDASTILSLRSTLGYLGFIRGTFLEVMMDDVLLILDVMKTMDTEKNFIVICPAVSCAIAHRLLPFRISNTLWSSWHGRYRSRGF